MSYNGCNLSQLRFSRCSVMSLGRERCCICSVRGMQHDMRYRIRCHTDGQVQQWLQPGLEQRLVAPGVRQNRQQLQRLAVRYSMQLLNHFLDVGFCHCVRDIVTVAAEQIMLLVGPAGQMHVMRAR